ncbi:kinase domain-containing protein [Dichotomopilus funicola]|uniref:non-specific serine/threonine protein kinase n=1 Tax=Dichotomopilus funicola TaxID=1934379 RepID=A0AAN6ZNM2_9PEZI|nr:kinase domain-containing protein [Dichotomopilus funicola]
MTSSAQSMVSTSPRPSPRASPHSSQPPSIRSVEAPTKSPKLNGQNGIPPIPGGVAEALQKPPSEKGSMKDRLTRMFSTKEAAHRAVAADANGTSAVKKGSQDVTPATASPPPVKPVTAKEPPGRFVLNLEAQGGHEHHLKSSRRQEKLVDLIKNFLGRKPEQAPEHDLSLVSNWVDNLRKEKDATLPDKKMASNPSATLVEKYGKCQEIVGRGAFGIVRISHKKLENGLGEKLYAVKEFRRRPEETEKRYSKRLTAEFCISSSLRHPNVIHTLDLLKDSKGDYCEVMEFCAGGDLYTLVLSATKLEVQEADCFFKQMMRGVEYMHEMGVAHRDLKPENLLLTTHGALKITDFGNGECFRMAWENDAHMVSGLCGSAPYIAPEEYTAKEFDARAVDVWACGVIYMAMRTGRHLWRVARKDEDEFYKRYLDGRRDEEGYAPIEALHRARCRNVIYSILDPNPSRRITASQVLKSEWGREIQLCKAGEEGL